MNNIINLEGVRGDNFELQLIFKTINGPININGWIIYFTIKEKTYKNDLSAVIKKDITTHILPSEGKTSIVLTHSETDNIIGTFQYDVQYKTPTDILKTFMRGTIKFIDDVTRRI